MPDTIPDLAAIRARTEEFAEKEEIDTIDLPEVARASARDVPPLLAEVERLRAELDAIGNLAYRADGTSPFLSEVLADLHSRAKRAARGGTA